MWRHLRDRMFALQRGDNRIDVMSGAVKQPAIWRGATWECSRLDARSPLSMLHLAGGRKLLLQQRSYEFMIG